MKDLGKLFTSHLRVIDKVRYGEMNGVILLPNRFTSQGCGEKLRESVENYPFKQKMTVSIGVSEFKKPLSRFELLMRVDRACIRPSAAEGTGRYLQPQFITCGRNHDGERESVAVPGG